MTAAIKDSEGGADRSEQANRRIDRWMFEKTEADVEDEAAEGDAEAREEGAELFMSEDEMEAAPNDQSDLPEGEVASGSVS